MHARSVIKSRVERRNAEPGQEIQIIRPGLIMKVLTSGKKMQVSPIRNEIGGQTNSCAQRRGLRIRISDMFVCPAHFVKFTL
jgi:hypothetical protein